MKVKNILIALLVMTMVALPASAVSFNDVSSDHWAYDAIEKVADAGIINGYSDGTFQGDKNVSRYEMAVMVNRVLNNLDKEYKQMAKNQKKLLNDQKTLAKTLRYNAKNLSDKEKTQIVEIVKSINAKNKKVDDLSEKEALKIADLIDELTFKYKAELKVLRSEVNELEEDMNSADSRITALENDKPEVIFSGSYTAEMEDNNIENSVGNEIPVNSDGDYELYANPWDDSSEEIDFAKDNNLEQKLNLNLNLNKENYKARVGVDLFEEDDSSDTLDEEKSYGVDSLYADYEDTILKASYREENESKLTDYAFAEDDFNGLNADLKKLDTEAVFGYVDEIDNTNKEFYVYGAQKDFEISPLTLKATIAGRRNKNDDNAFDQDEKDIFGLKTMTDLAGINLGLNYAYSNPVDENEKEGSYLEFDASSQFSMADLAFNYRNTEKEFTGLNADETIFDTDDDDYEIFVDGAAPGTKAWRVEVKPEMLNSFNPTFSYAAADEKDVVTAAEYDGESSKMNFAVNKKDLLMEGLSVDSNFAVISHDDDSSDYKDENRFAVDGEYSVTDHIALNAGYKMKTNYENIEDNKENIASFGAELSDYPLFANFDLTAGFSYKTVSGDTEYKGDYESLDEKDQQDRSYNLGLGYTKGKADFSYNYKNMKREGDNVVKEEVSGTNNNSYEVGRGTYSSNEFAVNYKLNQNADFNLSHRLLDLDNDNDNNIYDVQVTTAGFNFNF